MEEVIETSIYRGVARASIFLTDRIGEGHCHRMTVLSHRQRYHEIANEHPVIRQFQLRSMERTNTPEDDQLCGVDPDFRVSTQRREP